MRSLGNYWNPTLFSWLREASPRVILSIDAAGFWHERESLLIRRPFMNNNNKRTIVVFYGLIFASAAMWVFLAASLI